MKTKLFALLFVAIFAVAFIAGGVFGGLMPLWQAGSAAISASSRVAVPAQIVSLSLDRGSKGVIGARVRYSYTYGGTRYASEQINKQVSPNSRDNVGDWQRSWYDQLNRAKSEGGAITAWVNPSDPADAVLDNNVRWSMVWFAVPFATLFTGVGLAALYAFFYILFARTDETSDSKSSAVSVAMNARTLRGGSQIGLFFFGVVWSLLAVPMAVVAWSSESDALARGVTALFTLLGVWMILAGLRTVNVLRGARETTLELDPQQPQLESAFRVRIRVPRSTRRDLPAAIAITLQESIRDERGSSTTTRVGVSETFLANRVASAASASTDTVYEAIVKAPPSGHASGGIKGDLVYSWDVVLPRLPAFTTHSFGVSIFGNDASRGAFLDKYEARSFAESYKAFRDANPASRGAFLNSKECQIEIKGTQWSAHFPRRGLRGGSVFTIFCAFGCFAWYGWQLLYAPRLLAESIWLQAWPVFTGTALLLLVIHFATRTMRVQISRDGVAVIRDSWLTKHAATVALARVGGFDTTERYQTSNGASSLQHRAVYAHEISAGLRERVSPTSSNVGMLNALQFEMTEALQRVRDFGIGPAPEAPHPHYANAVRALTWVVAVAFLAAAAIVNHAFIHDRGSHFTLLDKLYAFPYGLPATSDITGTQKSANETQLIDALEANDFVTVRKMLEAGVSTKIESDSGDSLLHIAARNGRIEIVDLLLANGAEINRKIVRGQHVGATPLSSAIHCGDAKMVAHLIARGATPFGLNYYGWNYANLAAHVNCVDCLVALKKANVDIDAFAPAGRRETPIMTAARFAKHESITWLAKEGASLTKRDPYGYNVMGWAHFFKQEATKPLLLSLGADPDVGEKRAANTP